MQADLLRKKFLDFFKARKHRIVDSDSLVPKDDPTVLFTPAGMNQFKKEFLGFNPGFSRAATAQRCLRTDDLDKVGKTIGHHTFFEMLGNFSFGDYFKKEAIQWAWEFLTQELGISEDKLWVSVYKDDEEAYNIWKDAVKVPAHKVVKLGDKENFWPSEAKIKGPNGPCGPCSEIFYDFGKDKGCGESICDPSCSCGRFVEIWNLVFTQFNRKEGAVLEPLSQKNIDTGMGLERLAAVMQGAENNFETDLFKPLIKEITNYELRITNYELIYAVADHIRAVVFSIYDGVLPENDGRGYVVRKLIRKSVLHLRALGIKHAFLYRLVPVVAQIMQDPYPHLLERKENISEIILAEENNFISTLNSSENLFKDKFLTFIKEQNPEKAGRIAFQLFDTYGIPLELTVEWLAKHGVKFSQSTFEEELKQQKTRSKLQSAMKGDVFSLKEIDYCAKKTEFLGYKEYSSKAKIVRIIKGDKPVKKIVKAEQATIVLDKSVFYAESGGQAGDAGEIIKGKNVFTVTDTKQAGKVILHIGSVKDGSFKANDFVSADINIQRRISIARNHTATHLLQAALRKVLGEHVKQQGSLVAEDRLRFDFTHFKDISDEQINRIEQFVNEAIMQNFPVRKKQKTLAQAKKTGALAFFAEKYENKVRLISIDKISLELCGGTHLDATGQIGYFKILQEGSVASGVRRIEATTGEFAYKKIKEEETVISDIVSSLNVPVNKVVEEIEKRSARIKELEKELASRKAESLKASLDNSMQEAQIINGIKFIAKVTDNVDMDLLRKNVDLLKEKLGSGIIVLGSSMPGKALLVVGVTQDLTQQNVDASLFIKEAGRFIGGSGGGRKDFAQAGGNNPQGFQQAFESIKSLIGKIK